MDIRVSSAKILYSRLVTGNRPMPKLSTQTRWHGRSLSWPRSQPITNDPPGIITTSVMRCRMFHNDEPRAMAKNLSRRGLRTNGELPYKRLSMKARRFYDTTSELKESARLSLRLLRHRFICGMILTASAYRPNPRPFTKTKLFASSSASRPAVSTTSTRASWRDIWASTSQETQTSSFRICPAPVR